MIGNKNRQKRAPPLWGTGNGPAGARVDPTSAKFTERARRFDA